MIGGERPLLAEISDQSDRAGAKWPIFDLMMNPAVSLFRLMHESIIVRVSFGSYWTCVLSISNANFIVGCSACTMSS